MKGTCLCLLYYAQLLWAGSDFLLTVDLSLQSAFYWWFPLQRGQRLIPKVKGRHFGINSAPWAPLKLDAASYIEAISDHMLGHLQVVIELKIPGFVIDEEKIYSPKKEIPS